MAKAATEDSAFWNAEVRRLEAELGAQRGESDAWVEAAYREALSIAETQGARSLALRATTGLARFLSSRGERASAEALLREGVMQFINIVPSSV